MTPVLYSYEHLGLWCAMRHIVMFCEGERKCVDNRKTYIGKEAQIERYRGGETDVERGRQTEGRR